MAPKVLGPTVRRGREPRHIQLLGAGPCGRVAHEMGPGHGGIKAERQSAATDTNYFECVLHGFQTDSMRRPCAPD